MAGEPTTGDLFKAKIVQPEVLRAATDGSMKCQVAKAFPIADGYMLDLESTVAARKGRQTSWLTRPSARPSSVTRRRLRSCWRGK